ncbi:MAG: nucleotidyltransferase domain-containing protein [Planctomycetes bacterium]|nr:nucleotidyltransferase domain-containing protein [Planctomycetota bacterium]
MLRWPARGEVLAAVETWAASLRASHPEVVNVGVFGSLAGGGYGVGSDADIVVIADCSNLDSAARYVRYCPDGLPVPADLRVYTPAEWAAQIAAQAALTPRWTDHVRWLPYVPAARDVTSPAGPAA